MANPIWRSELRKAKHKNHLLVFFLIVALLLNVGQAAYFWYQSPSSKVVNGYELRLKQKDEEIKNLSDQLKNSKNQAEQVTFGIDR